MPNPVDARKSEFAAALEFLDHELKSLRSGRASAAIVETIQVEAYGGSQELKAVASISIPDPKTIQIEPWDKKLVKDVEKALIAADLGMQPNTAGAVIRLTLPAMTEENRKRLVKQVHEQAEAARISLRNIREKIRDEVQKLERDKQIGEDEKFRLQEQLDKLVAEMNAKVETVAKKKEEEIMTI